MKKALYIFAVLCISIFNLFAQRDIKGGAGGGSFSLSSRNTEERDSISMDSLLRSGKRITVYNLTKRIGDKYEIERDTSILNTAQKTYMEHNGISVGYLANIGSPAQSRIFSERKEARDFIFADAYTYLIMTPENAKFYDTKVPYTEMLYHKTFGTDKSEERLSGMMTFNFGKKLNVGADFDYLYSRGQYYSSGSKLYNFRIFTSYHTDRYNLNAYFYNQNYVNFENGGLTEDEYVKNPDWDSQGGKTKDTRDYPVKFTTGNVWNRVKGKTFFLTHRYNLGYTTDETDETDEEFVPVASIIHTLDYSDNFRRFIAKENTPLLDTIYSSLSGEYGMPLNKYNLKDTLTLNDRMEMSQIKNTIGLSMREGFKDWVKFGLTAFVSFENRSFEYPSDNRNLSDSIVRYTKKKEFTTYVGGELSSRSTDFLTYYAFGELGVVGDDIGEFRVNGHVQTNFKLFGKEASVKALGRIENTTPAFFQRHYYSRYFTWNNNDFGKIQRYYLGGEVNLGSTNTTLSAGVENVTNYVYFASNGLPTQHKGSIQILNARLKQNFYFRGFGWENEIVGQLGSKDNVLPLPTLSAYSNLYVYFKVAKVMTVQLGADVRYFSEYYAPYYEPATQQFQLQKEKYNDPNMKRVKVGNYPLINAYANLHLKQAKFFVSAYNLGSMFLETNHFSFAHYPLNPFTIKLGVSVYFNN